MTARDRRSAPPAAPVRPFEFPDVDRQGLANGLVVRVAALPRLPLVSAVLVLPASEATLEERRAGLAVLTAEALDGGTARRSAGEVALAFESLGSGLHTGAGWDATTASFTCLAERLPEVLELAAEVVRTSSFPDSELSRVRDMQLARIRQRAMDPSAVAADWATKLFYREGAAYGRPLAGTAETVASHDREAVATFAGAMYRPSGSALALAGDVDAEEAATLAERIFGDWTGSPGARHDPAEGFRAPARFQTRTVHLVHRAGSVQSELRVGYPGLPRRHEDYFPLLVANTVLGGAFTSRLNLSLRERHGFTYGVRSRFAFRRGPGPFSVSTAVGQDVTAAAVREIFTELDRFAGAGPTDEEVSAARDYIAGVFPLRMETTAQVAARLAEVSMYDLPEDHHARFRERIREVDGAVAREAVSKHVRPAEMTVVVVGDADAVGPSVEALDLGPVEVHTP